MKFLNGRPRKCQVQLDTPNIEGTLRGLICRKIQQQPPSESAPPGRAHRRARLILREQMRLQEAYADRVFVQRLFIID